MKSILNALNLPETASEQDAVKAIAGLHEFKQKSEQQLIASCGVPLELVPKFEAEFKRRKSSLPGGASFSDEDLKEAVRNQFRADGLLK